MSDFNFFEPYKSKQFKSDKAVSGIKIFLVFITFVLIGFTGFEFYTKIQLEKELKTKQDYIDSESNKKQIEDRKLIIKKVEELKQEKSSYGNLEIITKLANEATTDKFSNIVLNNVYGVFLQSVKIGTGKIEIVARASDMGKAANYESSLRNSKMFTNVFVSNLTKSDEFDLAIKDEQLEKNLKGELSENIQMDVDTNVFMEIIYPVGFTIVLEYNQTMLKSEELLQILGNEKSEESPEIEQNGEADQNTEPNIEEQQTN